jgi:hypothetical protein
MVSGTHENLRLDGATRDSIGQQLRLEYQEVTAAPLPDEHVYLLLSLRHKQRDRENERRAPHAGTLNHDHPQSAHDQSA